MDFLQLTKRDAKTAYGEKVDAIPVGASIIEWEWSDGSGSWAWSDDAALDVANWKESQGARVWLIEIIEGGA